MVASKRRYHSDSDGDEEFKPELTSTEDEGEMPSGSDHDEPLPRSKKARTGKEVVAASSRTRGRGARAKQTATSSVQSIDKAAVTVAYGVSDDEISKNPIHPNVRKVKMWLDNALRIKRYAPTNIPAAVRASIREWVNLPVISGRSHVVKRITRTSGGYWQATILNTSTANMFFAGDKKVVLVANPLVTGSDDKKMRNNCNALARQLCDIFRQCSIAYPTGSGGTSLAGMLIRLALEILYPDEKPREAWPTVSQRKGTGTMHNIAVWFADPNTNELGSYGVAAQPFTFVGVNPDSIPDVAQSH